MAERPIPSSKANGPKYAQKSDAARAESKDETPEGTPDRPLMPLMVKNTTKKKKQGLGSKFRQAFTGDDAQTVGHYLFFDVLVPGTKDILFNLLIEGSRRALFGSAGGGRSYGQSSSLGSRGPAYGRVFNGGASQQAVNQREQRIISPIARSTHNFETVEFATRSEAEQVLDGMIAYIDEYVWVTVADFYNASGIDATHVDSKHGWQDLSEAGVRGIYGGYVIDLPPTVEIR